MITAEEARTIYSVSEKAVEEFLEKADMSVRKAALSGLRNVDLHFSIEQQPHFPSHTTKMEFTPFARMVSERISKLGFKVFPRSHEYETRGTGEMYTGLFYNIQW